MPRTPEEDEEDGPISVPAPGEPDGDAPVIHDEEPVDDLAPSSSPEPFTPDDSAEAPPSTPPPWDEANDRADLDEHPSEIWTLLDPASDVDDDAPLGDTGDDADEDVAIPDDLDESDDPFDPGGDDDD